MRHAPENFFSFLLGDAAGNGNPHLRPGQFPLFNLPEKAEYLLLGLGPDAAGVQDNKIRAFISAVGRKPQGKRSCSMISESLLFIWQPKVFM